MTPYMMIVVLAWAVTNPASQFGEDGATIRQVFPDQQICEIALQETIAEHEAIHENATADGVCVPAEGRGA